MTCDLRSDPTPSAPTGRPCRNHPTYDLTSQGNLILRACAKHTLAQLTSNYTSAHALNQLALFPTPDQAS